MEKSTTIGRNESAVLNSRTFEKIKGTKYTDAMTIRGAVNKTTILLAIVAVSATLGWLSVSQTGLGMVVWAIPATFGALALAIITSARMQAAPITAPLYAFLEGSVLGCVSAFFEAEYPGIVTNAVFLTFGTMLGLLLIYRANDFHVTTRFREGVASATLAILLVYIANAVLHLFGLQGIAFIHQSGLVGIGFSLFVVFIAAMNLMLDFDLIEKGIREGAPKYMEWYSAFGLMVSLIWLYLEVLRLLAILASSSDDN